jgi:GTPase SAR1 family protein
MADEAGKCFGGMLSHNSILTTLGLGTNLCGDATAGALAEGLKLNSSLTTLWVNTNSFGAKGAVLLADALKHNHALKVLNISFNRIEKAGGMAFASTLRTNTKLEVLNLGGNNIGEEGGEALLQALSANTAISEMALSKNGISKKRLKEIKGVLKRTARREAEWARRNPDSREYDPSSGSAEKEGAGGGSTGVASMLQHGSLLHATMTSTFATALASGGGQPLRRSKLCLVGEGRVGKTCVLRAMLDKEFQETASTVGAETSLVEAHPVESRKKSRCELERFDVKDWQMYEALGEFDSAMARHIAVHIQQVIDFAKARGKQANELSDEDLVELQEVMEAEEGDEGDTSSKEILELIRKLCPSQETMEVKGAAVAVGLTAAEGLAPEGLSGGALVLVSAADTGSGHDDPGVSATTTSTASTTNASTSNDVDATESAQAGREDAASATMTTAVTQLPQDMVLQLIENGIDASARKMIFSTWDYGGQHIFRIVHHLFLTRFAVYLVVFNMADLVGDTATEETREKCLAELHGWLNDLWMHAAMAPVIPVGTHLDMVSEEDGALERVDSLLRQRFEGTRFWPHLASNTAEGLVFFPVDSRTRTEDGRADITVRQLRQKVEKMAQGEEYIDKQVPLSWLQVLDRLQTMSRGHGSGGAIDGTGKRGKVRRLSLKGVCEIAQECGLPTDPSMSVEEEVAGLLDLFHELGMLVHYNEPKLKGMVVLDPQWLIDLISRIIRVHEGNLHELPLIDEKARRQLPEQWQQLVKGGQLSRGLVEVLWEGLTEGVEERDTLLVMLQKFDLLLQWRSGGGDDEQGGSSEVKEEEGGDNGRDAEGIDATGLQGTFLVPSMLPDLLPLMPRPEDFAKDGVHNPEFYLVFRSSSSSGELSFDQASKGFLPEGLFPRLLKKAASWYQYTSGPAQGGMKPVLFRSWAQISFGNHSFVVELLEAQQMIRVQLLVQNPTLVVERIEQMVEEIRQECMLHLKFFVAVKVPAVENILISLKRVQMTIGEGALELFVGEGLQQQRLDRACFALWCPPEVEDYYDIFISYRQSSDTEFARMLYDCLSKFVCGKEGRRLKVFLDSKRLLTGHSWKEGFIEGLKRTTILVPIISKGAIEPMSQLDPDNSKDWCDNVLLEWKLGLSLKKMDGFPLQAIFPIMVGSVDPLASHKMADFFVEAAGVKLSDSASKATDRELLRVLPGAHEMVGMGVAETKQRLLEQLGVKAWDPASTHGKYQATTHWDVHAGCAKQIFQLLGSSMAKNGVESQVALQLAVSSSPRPSSTRAKRDFRASAVSSVEMVLLEGPLMKLSSGVLKRWQQRYFAIAGHYLKYGASEEDVQTSPKAVVDLNALRNVAVERRTFLHLEFVDGICLELQAPSVEETDGWYEVLQQFATVAATSGADATSGLAAARKTSLLQSLEHYAPRKGTLHFEMKGSLESRAQSTAPTAPSPAATAPASAASPPASPAASAQHPPSSWSTEQVAAWLAGIGEAYGNYSAAFVENGIDGEELLSEDFGLDELKEFGVISKVHQKRILKEIKKLRR